MNIDWYEYFPNDPFSIVIPHINFIDEMILWCDYLNGKMYYCFNDETCQYGYMAVFDNIDDLGMFISGCQANIYFE